MLRAIKNYFTKRKDRIDLLLKKMNFYNEDYHQMRVEIKKLNALFSLLNSCFEDFKLKKSFKPFKVVFKQAGIIRELQLEIAVLKKNSIDTSAGSYYSTLIQRERTAKKFFLTIIDHKLMKTMNESFKDVLPFIKTLHKKNVNDYLAKKRKEINSFINKKKLKPQEIHEIRKKLKSYYYTLKSSELSKQENKEIKTDAFQELLGKWHDCRVMSDHLEKEINKGEVKQTELKLLEKIKAKLSLQAAKLFVKITDAIKADGILPDDKIALN